MSDPEEPIIRWVIESRPLFANRVIWDCSPEMAEVRRRLMAEYEASRPAPADQEAP